MEAATTAAAPGRLDTEERAARIERARARARAAAAPSAPPPPPAAAGGGGDGGGAASLALAEKLRKEEEGERLKAEEEEREKAKADAAAEAAARQFQGAAVGDGGGGAAVGDDGGDPAAGGGDPAAGGGGAAVGGDLQEMYENIVLNAENNFDKRRRLTNAIDEKLFDAGLEDDAIPYRDSDAFEADWGGGASMTVSALKEKVDDYLNIQSAKVPEVAELMDRGQTLTPVQIFDQLFPDEFD